MECIETPPILHLLVSGLNYPVIHLIYVLYVLKMSELDFAASFLCFFSGNHVKFFARDVELVKAQAFWTVPLYTLGQILCHVGS